MLHSDRPLGAVASSRRNHKSDRRARPCRVTNPSDEGCAGLSPLGILDGLPPRWEADVQLTPHADDRPAVTRLPGALVTVVHEETFRASSTDEERER